MSIFGELKKRADSGTYWARINIYGNKVNKLQTNEGLHISRTEWQDPYRKKGMKTYKVSWEHATVSDMPQNATEIERLPVAQQLWLISTAARKKK